LSIDNNDKAKMYHENKDNGNESCKNKLKDLLVPEETYKDLEGIKGNTPCDNDESQQRIQHLDEISLSLSNKGSVSENEPSESK